MTLNDWRAVPIYTPCKQSPSLSETQSLTELRGVCTISEEWEKLTQLPAVSIRFIWTSHKISLKWYQVGDHGRYDLNIEVQKIQDATVFLSGSFTLYGDVGRHADLMSWKSQAKDPARCSTCTSNFITSIFVCDGFINTSHLECAAFMWNHKHTLPASNLAYYHTIIIITVNPEYCYIILRMLHGTQMV